MKLSLSDTTATEISKKLVALRSKFGQATRTIVFTLIVYIEDTTQKDAILNIAKAAAKSHPCRLIALVNTHDGKKNTLTAQLSIGEDDAGSAEVIVLYLNGELSKYSLNVVYPFRVPDTPVVLWWPEHTDFTVQNNPIRELADRRITTNFTTTDTNKLLQHLAGMYVPGDTDLVWTKITHFRSVITSLMDYENLNDLVKVSVSGPKEKLTSDFLAAWLASLLPTKVERKVGNYEVEFVFKNKQLALVLDTKSNDRLQIKENGKLLRSQTLPAYTITNLLANELVRLEPDPIYANTLQNFRKVIYV